MGFDRVRRGLHISGMTKTEEKVERELTSAEIIRELRGPLPEDDPHFELVDGEYVLRNPRVLSPAEKEAVQGVLRDLQALPPGTTLPWPDIIALLARLPGPPRDGTAADVIRESDGPLAEDDPFSNDRRS
jgi:hypothetical protein